MKISLVAGARPNFMKIAPLARALKHVEVEPRLIHTGQHYDEQMSQTFFDELSIPKPDVNLGVGSGPHVWQLAEMMRRLAHELDQHRPNAVVVVGDVNSTLAAALTASKLGIPVAHVEAGLRSFDRSMPEETNRVLIDSLSEWLFTSEPSAEANLRREGVHPDKIYAVGNVMIDTLRAHVDSARVLGCHSELGLPAKNYAVLTLHRPSNVDHPERLASILRAVQELSREMPVVFPVHPRTRRRIEEFGFQDRSDWSGVSQIAPQGYLSMLHLMDAAAFVMTDSGGMQEETTALQVPCLTLRENTERPITVEVGSNTLVGWKTDAILSVARRILQGDYPAGRVPENWDGQAAGRIARVLTADRQSVPQRAEPTGAVFV